MPHIKSKETGEFCYQASVKAIQESILGYRKAMALVYGQTAELNAFLQKLPKKEV